MEALLVRAGPSVYVILGLTGAWALISVLWTALAIARVRVPAPFWWVFPGLVLTAGGVATLLGYDEARKALELLQSSSPLAQLAGRADAALPLWIACWTTAVGLVITTPFMAAANIARAGDFAKWKPIHAVTAVIPLFGSLLGLLSSFETVAFGLVGAFAIALAAMRLGTGDDRRRMVAGRAFVGAMATLGTLALALAHGIGNRITVLDTWAHAGFESRGDLVAAAEASLPWLAAGDLSVAALLAVGSLGTLAPVARAVLDGRTSGGLLFSAFLAVVPTAAVAPAVLPLFQFEVVDEQGERQAALRSAGIELVEAAASDPWTPGTPVTVGVYWAHVADERVLPFKDGQVDEGDLDGDVAIPVASAIRGVRFDPVRIEIDRRADMVRLRPVLMALQHEGIDDVCFVVRSKTGAFGCLPAQVREPTTEPGHLLLRSVDTTLIHGEQEPLALDLRTDEARLGEVPGPLVVHPDHSVSAQRLLEALAHVNRVGDPPLLALE